MCPHVRLCSAQRCARKAGQHRQSVPHTGNWKLETEGHPRTASDSHLNKPNTRLTFAPSICGRPSPTTAQASWKSCSRPASCGTESFRARPLLWMRPLIFFLLISTKRILKLFFSLNFHPLYSSTQRDGTFGKIILSSTSTCDHNFKSRNLLSSCGENKGPGSDLGSGGGETEWRHRGRGKGQVE